MQSHSFTRRLLVLAILLIATQAVTMPRTHAGSSDSVKTGSYTWHHEPAASQQAVPMVSSQLSEGFENSWPGLGWQLAYNGPLNMEHLWARRTCRAHSGSYGAWSVGGGQQGSLLTCGSPYPNSIQTSAAYGPIDLTGVTSAKVVFYMWGKTEAPPPPPQVPYDLLFVGASTNNIDYNGTFYSGDYTTGQDGNSFYRQTVDLAGYLGQPQVWILFGFQSDISINDIGFVVDDIVLELNGVGPSPTTSTSTPTQTATRTSTTPTATASHTATATQTATAPVQAATPTSTVPPRVNLPLVVRPAPTATATAIPHSCKDGNANPGFPSPFSANSSTSFEYDQVGRLTGAVTLITVLSVPIDPDGDPLTYTWSASNGSITGNGPSATWQRLLIGGRVQPGTVELVVRDPCGGTAKATFK